MNRLPSLSFFIFLFIFGSFLYGQENEKYILGTPDESLLQIKVHVLGELRKPGEYIVSDKTDIVEIISKAGGVTEFSNLGKVLITRYTMPEGYQNDPTSKPRKEIIEYNVNEFLKDANSPRPPVLKPGDIIFVPRNGWSKWRSVATVVRDISVVISAYLLYRRTLQ